MDTLLPSLLHAREKRRGKTHGFRAPALTGTGTLSKVSSVLKFQRSDKVAVRVDGVADGPLLTRMVRDVRRVFRPLVGEWRVTVRASARGRWRLELCGAAGRHIWIIDAPAARLSAAVVDKLEAFLRDSAGGFRPLPAGA
jgi:hypothetical protein